MTQHDEKPDATEAWLNDLLRRLADEGKIAFPVTDAVAEAFEAAAEDTTISEDLNARLHVMMDRARVDAAVESARRTLRGTLGTVGTALRRVREAAGFSVGAMARRASVDARTWNALEAETQLPESLPPTALAGILIALQMPVREFREALRMTIAARLVGVAGASFRTTDRHNADTAAAFNDLLVATAPIVPERDSTQDAHLDRLLDGLREELRRCGRSDLL